MTKLLIILVCLWSAALHCLPVSAQDSRIQAESYRKALFNSSLIDCSEELHGDAGCLARVYHLSPKGYLVISSRKELPPLVAYSDQSTFHDPDGQDILAELLIADLSQRLVVSSGLHPDWQRVFDQDYLAGLARNSQNRSILLNTNWTQNYPYNMMCPMDTVTNQRSVAGCPAIAMGQIVNYLQALNGTRLNDTDDYYHNYAGRNYWIDNDHASLGFPSFPELNGYLDEINYRFRYDIPLSDSLKAALIFASGTALKQVYSSAGSGTFAVNQAYAAYQRFGFNECALITLDSPELYTRMADNIQLGFPVHLAVVTPNWDAGHNVVVDGNNDEGYFHLNFGWGGSYNGWYLLPSQIPYNLTVIEGAVVDIFPKQYITTLPDEITLQTGQASSLMIINQENRDLVLEAWRVGPETDPQNWSITGPSPFPIVIPALGITDLSISYNEPSREWFSTTLKLILDEGVHRIPLLYESSSAADDPAVPAPSLQVLCYPNPFRDRANIMIDKATSSSLDIVIYNQRGERIRTIHESSITQEKAYYEWDGRDSKGNSVPTGIYFLRAISGKEKTVKKIVRF